MGNDRIFERITEKFMLILILKSNETNTLRKTSIDQKMILMLVISTFKLIFLRKGQECSNLRLIFAKYVGSKYAVAVQMYSCSSFTLYCFGSIKGDRVITTPITFAASANCVRYCGGEVVVCRY